MDIKEWSVWIEIDEIIWEIFENVIKICFKHHFVVSLAKLNGKRSCGKSYKQLIKHS